MIGIVSAMYLTHLFKEIEKGITIFILTDTVYAYIMELAVFITSKAELSYYAEALKHKLKNSRIRAATIYL